MAKREHSTQPEPIVSRMSIMGHPIHPMLIHLPVAALIGAIATDIAFIYTEDYFWARAGIWLVGIGAAGGWGSGMVGMIDLVTVPQIRRMIAGWIHAVFAVTLLSLASFNWLLRFMGQPDTAIMPWGLSLSLVTGVLIAVTSALGGKLVYERAVGVKVG